MFIHLYADCVVYCININRLKTVLAKDFCPFTPLTSSSHAELDILISCDSFVFMEISVSVR